MHDKIQFCRFDEDFIIGYANGASRKDVLIS